MYKQFIRTAAICAGLSISIAFSSNAQQNNSPSRPSGDLPVENTLNKVMLLKPVKLSTAGNQTGSPYGFKIEDLEKVFPEMVKMEGKFVSSGKNAFRTEKVKTVDLEGLIPVLIASIKEQQEEIAKLKAEVQKLKEGK